MAIPSINDDTVLQIVHQWPPQQRFALIRDLLDSLEPASAMGRHVATRRGFACDNATAPR